MDDLISRQEAIDVLIKDCKESDKGMLNMYDIVCDLKDVPSAQPDLITKIQNGIKATDADDEYSCGMRNGMRWCKALLDDKEPEYEEVPSAQLAQNLTKGCTGDLP